MSDDSIQNLFAKHARLIEQAKREARTAKTIATLALMASVASVLFGLAASGAFG